MLGGNGILTNASDEAHGQSKWSTPTRVHDIHALILGRSQTGIAAFRLSIFSKCLIRACFLFLAPTSLQAVADDTASVDAIIDAYYEVISGPVGFVYDAERDENIHSPDAVITKFFLDGTVQQHDFKTEQASIVTPYETPFFEFEVDRKIEQFGNIAHVWSEFEMKTESDGDAYGGGFNSISLLFGRSCWFVVVDTVQGARNRFPGITTSAIGRLGHEQFAEVVKSVSKTRSGLRGSGGMEGRAKMNLAVVGEVKAKLVCNQDD